MPRDDSHEKWCPLMEAASCYQDCGWYDKSGKKCSILYLKDIAGFLLSTADAFQKIGFSLALMAKPHLEDDNENGKTRR